MDLFDATVCPYNDSISILGIRIVRFEFKHEFKRVFLLYSGTGYAEVLNQAEVPILHDYWCSRPDYYGNKFFKAVSFCAGYRSGGQDACSVITTVSFKGHCVNCLHIVLKHAQLINELRNNSFKIKLSSVYSMHRQRTTMITPILYHVM